MDQWSSVEMEKPCNVNQGHPEFSEAKHSTGGDEKLENIDTSTSISKVYREDTVLEPGSDIKPKVEQKDVESLLSHLYGITISKIQELISYDDRNYWVIADANIKNAFITSQWPHGYVLKILNALDSKKTNFVDAQNNLLLYLSKHNLQCPGPIANVNGEYYSVESINGIQHVVRLLEFIPGKIFHEVETTNNLLYQCGQYLARLDLTLKNFTHDAYESHKTLWMLQSIPKLREFLYVIKDPIRKTMVEEIIDAFDTKVLCRITELDMQIIHGDFNEQNIIVTTDAKSGSDYIVSGVIDFGDTNKSPLIFEIGIAMAYMMMQAKTLESGGIFLAGYTSINPVKATEKTCLKYCVAARLAQSLTLGAYTHSLHPSNNYVMATQVEGWRLIEKLWRESFETIDNLWENTQVNM